MKLLAAFLILSSASFACAQSSAPVATVGPGASTQNPADQNVRKAKTVIEQMVAALGGQRYLSLQSMTQEGRTSSFYHGKPTGSITPFWRFVKYPDKERVELLKTREWVFVYNGDAAYETTYH